MESVEAVRHSSQPQAGTNRLRCHLPLADLPCQHSGCTLHGREHTLIQSLQQRVDMSQEWSVLVLRLRLSSSPPPWLMQCGTTSSTLHLQQELVVLMQLRLRLSSSPPPWLMQGAHNSTLHLQQELVVVVAEVVVQ